MRRASTWWMLLSVAVACTRKQDAGVSAPAGAYAVQDAIVLRESDIDFPLEGLDDGGIASLGKGRFALLDYRGKHVRVFDRTGAPVDTLGSAGGGPGEFLFPQRLVPLLDGVGVLDGQKQAIVRFDAAGAVLPALPLDSIVGVAAPRITGLRQVAADAWAYSALEPAPGRWREGLYLRTSTGVRPLASTPTARAVPIRMPCNVILPEEPPVFWPTVRWDARGAQVVAAHDASDTLWTRSADAATAIVLGLPAREPTASDALVLAIGFEVHASGSSCRLTREQALEQRTMAPTLPSITRVLVSPSGETWVLPAAARGATRTVRVVSVDGHVDSLPGAAMPVAFLDDTLYLASEEDADGLAALRRWRVRSARAARR